LTAGDDLIGAKDPEFQRVPPHVGIHVHRAHLGFDVEVHFKNFSSLVFLPGENPRPCVWARGPNLISTQYL
jgi:hypothetical protein